MIKYRDSDGKELYWVLYYPVDYEEGKKYPLVCEIYETFFNNGFFGFRPSVNLIKGYPGEAWIKGITSGINVLIERGLVDPDKLGVHGAGWASDEADYLDQWKRIINWYKTHFEKRKEKNN